MTASKVQSPASSKQAAVACLLVVVALNFAPVGGSVVWAQEPPAADQPKETSKPSEPGSGGNPSTLPLFEDMALPTAEELLNGERRDWIVLTDEHVLIVEPVYPRPNTLEKMQAERDSIVNDRNRRFSAEGRRRISELASLAVIPLGDKEAAEYALELDRIERIVFHEDLLLQRTDKLIAEKQFKTALEILFVLNRLVPDWPGISDRESKLRIAEATEALADNNPERALVYIQPLYESRRPPREAGELLQRAADRLVGDAVEQQLWRKARFELSRIAGIDKNHPAVAAWTQKMTGLANTARDEAQQFAAAGRSADAATRIHEAASIWPALDSLRNLHAKLTANYQRVIVGVPQVAPVDAVAFPARAVERTRRLTYADLFELNGFDAIPSYRSAYFERWEPTDLGRQARFTLRPTLPDWAARQPITAPAVVSLLTRRLTRTGGEFDPRFADTVQSLQVTSPIDFEVAFNRIPMRTETVLSPPELPLPGRLPPSPLFDRFVEKQRGDGPAGKAEFGPRVEYSRQKPEATVAASLQPGPRHVAEVIEQAFSNYEAAARAFDRGEVQMLAELPLWDVSRLQAAEQFRVVKLAVPATHLLLINPQSEPLQSTELRRSLAAAIDADDLLRRFAGEGGVPFGGKISAPYPTTHPGYDPLIPPRPYDLPLAFALSLAARKSKAGTPELIFAAPAEEVLWKNAEAMVASWERIGLEVRLVKAEEVGPDDRWDFAYRVLTVADPVAMLAPLLSVDAQARLESLDKLPDWLRQRLIDLERSSDAASAHAALIELHRLLYADVRIIPLFETDEFFATRGRFENLPEAPAAVYQQVERWTLPQNYPEER